MDTDGFVSEPSLPGALLVTAILADLAFLAAGVLLGIVLGRRK